MPGISYPKIEPGRFNMTLLLPKQIISRKTGYGIYPFYIQSRAKSIRTAIICIQTFKLTSTITCVYASTWIFT